MTNNETSFSAFLAAQRKALDKTLREVAEETKMSVTHIWGLEHGRHAPGLLVAGTIAEAYGTDIVTMYNLLKEDEAHYAYSRKPRKHGNQSAA